MSNADPNAPLPNPPLEVTCQQVAVRRAAGDPFLLLDCREADEYQTVNISGAVLLPMSELTERTAELEPYRSRDIVVHCHHGGRSLRVANWLRRQGFDRASSMAGGIDAWAIEIEPGMVRY